MQDDYDAHEGSEQFDPLLCYRGMVVQCETARQMGGVDWPVLTKSVTQWGQFGELYGASCSDSFSYFQAMLVIDCLTAQHGLDAVLLAFSDAGADFLGRFGLTHQEALDQAAAFFAQRAAGQGIFPAAGFFLPFRAGYGTVVSL